jgi:hypothetical protein
MFILGFVSSTCCPFVLHKKHYLRSQAQWLKSIILTTWKAEVKRTEV